MMHQEGDRLGARMVAPHGSARLIRAACPHGREPVGWSSRLVATASADCLIRTRARSGPAPGRPPHNMILRIDLAGALTAAGTDMRPDPSPDRQQRGDTW